MKIIVAGGSGYVGRRLVQRLRDAGHHAIILTRSPRVASNPIVGAVSWDAKTAAGPWLSELSGADAIVNLAGSSIGGGRWTHKRMADILGSRLSATGALVDALRRTPPERRPRVLVSASGIDFYGDRGDDVVSEGDRAGDSFLARVCEQWEAAAEAATPLGVRVVRLRTALVFGRGAAAFRLMVLPFRLFVGGPLGNGRQWFNWIHIEDLLALYERGLMDASLRGPFNALAPDVRRQRDVAKAIGQVMHRPSVVPAPALMLRLALGRQADLLLHGRKTTPARAQAAGFTFTYGDLPAALQNTLR
ncbi:MAG TPA: TIGR01777 family oxidoreductase [Candidatus Dormibacteraeota bacterium]